MLHCRQKNLFMARPESDGATSLMAASSTGLKAMPAPRPSSTMPGSTSSTKLPLTGARANSASPMAGSHRPATSGLRMPKRITIFAERPSENTAMLHARLDGDEGRQQHHGRAEQADRLRGAPARLVAVDHA